MYFIIGGDGKQYGPISDADLRTLSTFPEFADLFGLPAALEPPASVDWNTRDYELDIGGCVSRAWGLVIGNFGQLFLPVLIYILVAMAMGILGKIPIIGPLFSIVNLFISG